MSNPVLDRLGIIKLIDLVKTAINSKQDKVTGNAGQILGFDENGNLAAIDAVSKTEFDATINEITEGLKYINGEDVP